MTDADILESEPMDINDDDKPNEITIENGGDSTEAPSCSTPSGKVIQVTNVSPGATLQQLATLFGFLGTVTDIRLYPSDEATQVQVKVCFIKYEDIDHCGVAQHLTNTVFIDKALIVVPIQREEIPEEAQCQHLINSINAYATLAATGYLPSGFPTDETDGTIPGLPPPPVITCSTEPVEIEEIKRTLFVKNIDKSVTSEQLRAFFSGVGEVKYMRICNPTTGGNRYAFIEFSAPESVPIALQYNGVIFGGRCLQVEHAKSPIVKPESERIASGRNTSRTAGRDVVRRPSSVNLRKSRSRSADRRRSGSRGRTSKGRSRSKARSRSRSKPRKRRSRSPRRRSPVRSPRRRSRSRSRSRPQRPARSRSRSPVRRRRSPSRSRSRSTSRRRSRSRSRSRERRRKKITKSPSRSPRRKKKSRSKSRSPKRKSRRSLSKSPDRRKKGQDDQKDKDKSKDKEKGKSKDKDKEKEKDKDKYKEKDKEKEKEKGKDKEKSSPEKDLKTLLDKVYTYEEEKEKEKKKEKERSSKEKEMKKVDD